MVYEFSINETKYYFDGKTLELFKNNLPQREDVTIPLFKKNPKILGKAMLLVSELCNGSCLYCYERERFSSLNGSLMYKETANQIIQFLSRNYNEINVISFFGGEPLLNFDIITYFVENLQKKINVKNYEITTNAVLMDDNMIQFFIKYNFKVIISLDGPQQIHNHLRIGCPHYKVMEIIRKLKNTSLKDQIILNCTLTKYHLDNIKYNNLLKYFENIGIRYSISEVFTNIESLSLVGKEISNQKKIQQTYENLCNSYLNESNNEYVKPVIISLVEKNVHQFFCADLGNDNQILFNAKGEQYPCMSLLNKCRFKDYIINTFNVKENEKCSKCWAKLICTDCIGPFIKGEETPPYLEESCPRKGLYEYSLKLLISYYHNDINKFKKIITNFYKYRH